MGGTNPISQFIFFPNPTSQFSNPIPIFSHSQWPNPSPSGLNPIFPEQNLPIPIPILPLQDPDTPVQQQKWTRAGVSRPSMMVFGGIMYTNTDRKSVV